MDTWVIVLIIALVIVVCWVLWNHHIASAAAVVKAKSPIVGSTPSGLQGIANQIPIAGQVIGSARGVVSKVTKPIDNIVNGVNNTVINGLQHIPVVGNLLSVPNKVVGTVYNDTMNFLGL